MEYMLTLKGLLLCHPALTTLHKAKYSGGMYGLADLLKARTKEKI